MAKESHPHNDVFAHQVDTHQVDNHQVDAPQNNAGQIETIQRPASDSAILTEDCDDHCLDLCHGHFSSIVSVDSTTYLLAANEFGALAHINIPALTFAPPTPPPNA